MTRGDRPTGLHWVQRSLWTIHARRQLEGRAMRAAGTGHGMWNAGIDQAISILNLPAEDGLPRTAAACGPGCAARGSQGRVCSTPTNLRTSCQPGVRVATKLRPQIVPSRAPRGRRSRQGVRTSGLRRRQVHSRRLPRGPAGGAGAADVATHPVPPVGICTERPLMRRHIARAGNEQALEAYSSLV